MTKTFEVGKKYTTMVIDHSDSTLSKGNKVYECKYVGQKNSFLEAGCGSTALPMNYMLCHTYGWKEFKEPVVEKRRKYVYIGSMWNDGFSVTSNKDREDAIVEFTFTDGELTNVEIVK